jgi:diaminohydroxyphosphoribosylaminopyrimidine deaminase/5-amino-6-(5-phosphoribosylamino)uracil reductase
MKEQSDERWMRRALRISVLAREAAPNPMVGCVLLDASGKEIAEGYTQRYGSAHAEATALAKAGDRARGGTAYVTLEPCSIQSQTPPCADALIRHGLKRVVVAMIDPDKRIFGAGIQRLRDAGITVDVGVCEEIAAQLNRAFVKHRTTGNPLVIVKTAMTLDGKIATVDGDSRWITSSVTRKWVHRQLRGRCQAILVGIGTIVADNPQLTVRLDHPHRSQSPLRVIVDSKLRTPLDSEVVRQSASDGLTVIGYVDDTDNRISGFESAGVRLVHCKRDSTGRVDLNELLARLGHEFKITSVLVEAGPTICASLFENGLVDRYYSCIGPKLVGGAQSAGPIGGGGLVKVMDYALEPSEVAVRRSGKDIVARCEFLKKV